MAAPSVRRRAAVAAGVLATLTLLTGCGARAGDAGSGGGAGPGTPAPTSSTPAADLPVSPPKAKPPAGGTASGPVLELSGVAADGVEPGCVVFTADGKGYLLIGAKDKIPLNVPIKVRGQVVDNIMSYCQQGTPLQVDSVTQLAPGESY